VLGECASTSWLHSVSCPNSSCSCPDDGYWSCPESFASAYRRLRLSRNNNPRATSNGTPNPAVKPICAPVLLSGPSFADEAHVASDGLAVAVEEGPADSDEVEFSSTFQGRCTAYSCVRLPIVNLSESQQLAAPCPAPQQASQDPSGLTSHIVMVISSPVLPSTKR
jgi:hypothetical protein